MSRVFALALPSCFHRYFLIYVLTWDSRRSFWPWASKTQRMKLCVGSDNRHACSKLKKAVIRNNCLRKRNCFHGFFSVSIIGYWIEKVISPVYVFSLPFKELTFSSTTKTSSKWNTADKSHAATGFYLHLQLTVWL